MSVDIIDLGMGNVSSIVNLLNRLDIHIRLVSRPSDLNSNTIIIPGVGAIGAYVGRFRSLGFHDAIYSCAEKGKQVIGICLGFQLLTQWSEESGGIECLGLIKAQTCRLKGATTHNGWETFNFDRRTIADNTSFRAPSLTRKYLVNGRVYYNHEYGVECFDEKAITIPIDSFNERYSAMVVKDNVVGLQFHPEKSQSTGLALFKQLL